MLRVCLNCYGNYTTDSVYQWDQNHVLTLTGNNIGDISAIHFCNKKCDNARVVNVVKSSGEISAPIPNELLEMPYDVIAYVHSIDNNQAKTIEIINIPVIKRVKPDDYIFVENVDIVNFERLESDIQDFFVSMTNEYNSFTNLVNNEQENFINGFTDEYNSRVASGYFLGAEGATYILDRLDDVDAINETSGSFINVKDIAGDGLSDIVIYGNSNQDGDPTPENPINITSAGEDGSLDIESVGKNLFNPEVRFNRSNSGVTASVNSSKNGVINGTMEQSMTVLAPGTPARINISGLSVGDKVAISIKLLSGNYTKVSGSSFYCDIHDQNGNALSAYKIGGISTFNTTNATKIFTITQQMKDDGVTYIYPQIWGGVGDIFDNLEIQILIEIGDKVTEYEHYETSSISLPLSEPLRSIGEIKDEIARVNGVYGVIRRIKSVAINGLTPLGIEARDTCSNVGYEIPDINLLGYDAMCTHFTQATEWEYVPGKFIPRIDYNRVYFWLSTDIADMDTLADWLSYNDVKLNYVLAEEVFEPFDNQDLFDNIAIYDDVTNLRVTDNAPTWIQYYTNSNIGQRLVQTNKEMKAEHTRLQNRISELEALNNDTGWVLLTNTSTNDYIFSNNSGIYYRRKNDVLYLRGMIDTVKKAGLIATLPAGFRPGVTINFPVVGDIFGNTDKEYNGYLNGSVDVNGYIRLVDNYGALTRIDAVTFNVAIPL